MTRRVFILIVIVTAQWSAVFSQTDTVKLSIREACRLAVENNTSVINTALEKKKYELKTSEAQSKLYPQVEAYSNFNYYYSIPKMVLPGEIFGQTGMIAVQIGTKFDWSNGFKATQVLYNQSYFTSLKLARKLETLGELTIQQKKEEIIYQVEQLYYICKTTESQIGMISASIKNSEKLFEIADLQRANGLILKTDCSRITVSKNNLHTQVDNLEALRKQQVNSLKFLIGIDLSKDVLLSDSLVLIDSNVTGDEPAFDKRVELKLIDSQIELSSLTRNMNRQSYLPSLSGFGQYYYQGQRNEFDFLRGGDKFYKVGLVGLSLNIPVFDGLEKHAKIAQNEIEILQLRNTKKNITENFNREFRDAIAQYANNLIIVQRQQENITIAREAYSVSQQGYRQQLVPLTDLLLSESSLTEARLNYYNALLQLRLAALDVVKAKGELLDF